MDTYESLLYGILFNDYAHVDKAGHDVVEDYTIDTCDTADCGWETAVWKGEGDMIIVERYANKEAAIAGHNRWVEKCRTEHPTEAWSVQCDTVIQF